MTAKHRYLLAIVLFLLAFIPRAGGLDRFFTPDESAWIDRSRQFISGLLDSGHVCEPELEILGPRQGLQCTLRKGHPGVITMWTGSLGLLGYYSTAGHGKPLVSFLEELNLSPVDKAVLPWVRMPTVILTSALAPLVFLLLLKVLGKEGRKAIYIGLSAALFIALSPYEIALSRVLHTDALEMVFITLTVLTAYHYWAGRAGQRWLLLSGVFAGASLVEKSSALVLLPYTGLLSLLAIEPVKGHNLPAAVACYLRTTLWKYLLWLGLALAVFIILFPAMWIIPGDVLFTIFNDNFKYASQGHESGNFFMGSLSHDPGPFFYPVSWLFHNSPIVVAGLLLAVLGGILFIFSAIQYRRQGTGNAIERPRDISILRLSLALLVFILIFGGIMTLARKKQDRYILLLYPMLDILAAIGWVWLGGRLRGWKAWASTGGRKMSNYAMAAFALLTIAANGYYVETNTPYYLTYFNPALGGIKAAAQSLTLGWGEGLDLAGAYLNQKPEAESLVVSAWYANTLAPYFRGQSRDFADNKGELLSSDYIVTYLNQRQRKLPSPEVYDFIEQNFTPEKVITIQGVLYAWIYRSPHLSRFVEKQKFKGMAELLGWKFTNERIDPQQPRLKTGQSLSLEIYWQYLGKKADEPFFVRLVSSEGRILAETKMKPLPASAPPDSWTTGQLVVESGWFDIPADAPPGKYTLQIGFYTNAPQVKGGELLFRLDNPSIITIE